MSSFFLKNNKEAIAKYVSLKESEKEKTLNIKSHKRSFCGLRVFSLKNTEEVLGSNSTRHIPEFIKKEIELMLYPPLENIIKLHGHTYLPEERVFIYSSDGFDLNLKDYCKKNYKTEGSNQSSYLEKLNFFSDILSGKNILRK